MHSPCVIARLHDGLGNQMFQYAAARSVSLKRGLPLKLDLHHYESHALRHYGLDHFRIEAALALSEEAPVRFLPEHRRPKTSLAGRVLRKMFPADPVPVYNEKKWWKYDSGIFSGTGAVYLNGYWQAEKYFSDIDQVIRDDFRLRAGFSAEGAARARSMERENTVSVHVRRKDFVKKGIALPVGYYARAIDYLRQRDPGFRFHFFSDDLSWVRAHLLPLVSPDQRGEDSGGGADYEEMILMSQCRHHIISNSTFSWWAAWLCRRPGKTIIAPKTWWKTKHAAQDLIPQSWIRL